jgi:hypothetical protein
MQQHALQQRALQQQMAMVQEATLPQQQQQQQVYMMLSGPGSGELPTAGYAHEQLQFQSDQQLLQLQQQLGMLQLPAHHQQQQAVLQHQQHMQLQQLSLQQQQLVPQQQLLPIAQQPQQQQYLVMQHPPQQQQQQQVAALAVSYLPSDVQPPAGNSSFITNELPNRAQAYNSLLLDAGPGMITIRHQRPPQQQLALAGGAPSVALHMPAAAAAGVSSELLLPGFACPHAPLLQPQPQQSWAPLVQQHVLRSSAMEPMQQQQQQQLGGMLLPGMLHSGSSAASGSAGSSNFALGMPCGATAGDHGVSAAAAAGLAPQAVLSPHESTSSTLGQFNMHAIGRSWGL